jgi:transposase
VYISRTKPEELTIPRDIESLRSLVEGLIERIEALEGEKLSWLSEREGLLSRIQILESENRELRSRLDSNSRNSNRPPSSDGLKKQPALGRKKGGPRGGKKGHKGDTLEMSAHVDHIIPCRPEICVCGHPLAGVEGQVAERRQVFDLPQPKLEVTEYQRVVCECPCCKRQISGCFAEGVRAPVQYGSGVKSLLTLLSVRCCLSYEKIGQVFEDLFGRPINVGTIWSANQKAYGALEQAELDIRAQLLGQDVVHFDETGFRISSSLHWVHTAASKAYTYLFVHKKRGRKALESEYSILPYFEGWAVHDCLSSYFRFIHCLHSVCAAHLLRELMALEEQGKRWAKAFRQYLMLLYAFTDEGTSSLPAAMRPWAERRFGELLSMARAEEPAPKKIPGKSGKAKGTKGYNLYKRLEKRKKAVLAFVYHKEVPFTNNQAERDLRPAKIKQKIAGCFRTEYGAQIYARIQGFISTAQKQGLNIFNELRAAFDGKPYSFAPDGS